MTCVWESGSVEDVQAYVDEIMGDSSSNLCYAVESQAASPRRRRGFPSDPRLLRRARSDDEAHASPGLLMARRSRLVRRRRVGEHRPHATGATIGRWSARCDRGGRQTDAPIDRREHELADWELLTDALVGALSAGGVMNVDELRRGIEHAAGGVRARVVLRALALLGGDDSRRERRPRQGQLDRRVGVTFAPGQTVRVAERMHEGHHRTPGYLKGAPGRSSACESLCEPGDARVRADGLPRQRLYLVAFAQRDVWPRYARHSDDRLYADVFEHWLEEIA